MKNARKIKDLLYEQVARIGKVFSSPKRLELIELLCQGEKTVEMLANEASISVKLACFARAKRPWRCWPMKPPSA